MEILDTIRSYLISLGFNVDRGSFDQAKKAVDSIASGVEKLAPKFITTMGKASLATAGLIAVVNSAAASLMNYLGNQEISMEKLSRQLWTTQQQATAFNATLQAMGANLQDLYLSPTLMNQYQQLHGVAMGISTPGDYTQQIKMVQDVQLQIKQMRLEAYYSLQWIGYYFIKYMSGPISKVHDVLQSINQVIIKNMPTWTKRVAEVMASFVQAGIYITQALGKVWGWLKKVADYVPGWAKAIAAGLALISISNPFMLFAEGISAALLLLDDFETYLRNPTKSAFPQFWTWVIKISNAMKKMGDGQQFVDMVKSLSGALNSLASGIESVVQGLGHLYGLLTGNGKQSDITNFLQMVWNLSTGIMNSVIASVNAFGDLAQIVGDLMQFKWKAALGAAQDLFKNGGNLGIMPGLPSANSLMPGLYTMFLSRAGTGGKQYPYMYPQTGAGGSKNVTVNANQTNHIHGGSAQATAAAVQHGYNRHLHNIKGVIR